MHVWDLNLKYYSYNFSCFLLANATDFKQSYLFWLLLDSSLSTSREVLVVILVKAWWSKIWQLHCDNRTLRYGSSNHCSWLLLAKKKLQHVTLTDKSANRYSALKIKSWCSPSLNMSQLVPKCLTLLNIWTKRIANIFWQAKNKSRVIVVASLVRFKEIQKGNKVKALLF